MHYFGVSNSRKMFRYEHTQSTPFDRKWCFTVFRNISQTFDTKKWCKFYVSSLRALFWGIELLKKVSQRTHPAYSIRHKKKFGCVSEHFANLRHGKLCKICVSSLNVLFRGIELPQKLLLWSHPIYNIRPKMMLRSVSKHFMNLHHEKLCKTCVLAVNALFRGAELPKIVSRRTHPINTIRAKTMFGSVLM